MITIFRKTKTIKTLISTYWIIFGIFWLETVLASEDSLNIKLVIIVFLGVLPLLMGGWLAAEANLLKRA